MLTAELQVRTAQLRVAQLRSIGVNPNAGRRYKTIAHYSERMDRVITLEPAIPGGPNNLLQGRMLLTKELTYDAASCDTSLKFRRGDAMFVLYATRLSDLKTTRIVEISDAVNLDDDNEHDFHRYLLEGDDSGERNACTALPTLRIPAILLTLSSRTFSLIPPFSFEKEISHRFLVQSYNFSDKSLMKFLRKKM